MITLFLEYMPNNKEMGKLKLNICSIRNFDIVALTPIVCYQLDRIGFDYTIPEDYFYPERLDIKKVYDSFDFDKHIKNTFILPFLEAAETKHFWVNVVENYVVKKKPDKIELFYRDFKTLKEVIDERIC